MGNTLTDHINQYTSSDSLLVHTRSRGLIRLYCPFTVEVIQSVDTFMVGEEKEVVQVKATPDLDLVYIIDGKGYYYHYFSIRL